MSIDRINFIGKSNKRIFIHYNCGILKEKCLLYAKADEMVFHDHTLVHDMKIRITYN